MVKKVLKQLPIYARAYRPPALAFRSVLSKDGHGIYASSDTLFKGAVFGRDSLEVAEDLLYIKPKLVKQILLTLASLQGEKDSRDNEEEVGKIIHEYRRSVVDGRHIDDNSQHILDQLSAKWGGSKDFLAYYGSIDATPHFIRVLGKYTRRYGIRILERQVTKQSGSEVSVFEVFEQSVNWLLGQLQRSKSGLLEYKRRNPHGIDNQVWKDSSEFYIHESGHVANHSQPIASIEVQALVYDALTTAARIIPSREAELLNHAARVQENALKRFWQPDRQYFALGLDYDTDGDTRNIETTTANAAEMLESSIFDDLPVKLRREYISGIVRNIMGTDFLTDAGIRSRALHEANLVHFWDYHGSYTSWPKETYDVAKGLRRQGMPKLARQLENRLLNVTRAVRAYPEFVYVDFRGRVLGMASSTRNHGELVYVDSTNQPEKIQAWTVSAILAIKTKPLSRPLQLIKKPHYHQERWQQDLEKEVLAHIPIVQDYKSAKALAARYPTYPYMLNKK